MGAPPAWWTLIQASRYLRVPPWALAEQPVMWMRIAVMAMEAEAVEERRRNERKQG